MKTQVVRARISPELKADAGNVLQGLGLEMSDAIRLFLCQVVRRRGLPFEIREGPARVVSGKRLWAMKRKGQAQSRQLATSGAIPPRGRVHVAR